MSADTSATGPCRARKFPLRYNERMKPQPSTNPIFSAFMGDAGHRIDAVSDHHIPSGFGAYRCVVHEMKLDMVNFLTMKMDVSFTIEGDPASLANLYSEEQWKFRRTELLLEKYPEAAALTTPAPLFAILLNRGLQVIDGSLRVAGPGGNPPLVIDQSCDLLLLPDSYAPLAGLPSGATYSYYGKKATIFYSDIRLNTRYDVSIDLEANAGTFELAPVFPYGNVVIEKVEPVSSGDFDYNPLAMKVQPERGSHFPEWYEENIDHKADLGAPRRRPNFPAASPFRGEMPLFNMEGEILSRAPKSEKEAMKIMESLMLDLEKPIVLTNYETVRFPAMIVIPPGKDVEVNVRTIQRPLPVRIYEKMQNLPMYQDVLVRYDIINMSHEKLRVRIETEILDYTDRTRNIITVPPLNNKRDKKARVIISQCPLLKRGLLEQIVAPTRATIHCVVSNEDTKEVLFEETRPIDLLANDEMVWGLKDIRSNTDFELHDFVGAWITPRDRDGLIERVRTEAAKLRPNKAFGDATATLGDIESHARAVYDYLAANGMSYVSQSFSAVSMPDSQRVVLPEVVLRNNVGNCIDLTVLFASILEGVGIYSFVFLTKDHAFIGWGNKNNADEILFLETTAIGSATFDEAVALGRKAFDDNFTFQGMPPGAMMPPFLAAELKGCHIVDMQEVRYSGKVAARPA